MFCPPIGDLLTLQTRGSALSLSEQELKGAGESWQAEQSERGVVE